MAYEASKVQRLLAAAGYYNGAIDGDLGDKSKAGILQILARHASLLRVGSSPMTPQREAVAAAQFILHFAGFEVGDVDGYWGNLTEGAFIEWEHEKTYGSKLKLDTTPVASPTPPRSPFPKQANRIAFYGTPGKGSALERSLVMVDLPYPMRIDWNTGQTATRAQLHPKAAPGAVAALTDILAAYGLATLQRLGLDRHAGTYYPRRVRGGTDWSNHAFGAAWDFYAEPNGLTVRCPNALFCKPEYATFFDIWERHGWRSLGRVIGRDWMHVEAISN